MRKMGSVPVYMLTVKRDGYSIAGLVGYSATKEALTRGVALFPGHPGIIKLRQEDGALKFEMRGNFLVRSRRHWLDDETLVMVVDAPSDQWASFYQEFRARPRYGADVGALVAEASRKHGVKDWTFVGTSEGSVSAFHAARMNPELTRRVILTASMFVAGKNGPGLSTRASSRPTARRRRRRSGAASRSSACAAAAAGRAGCARRSPRTASSAPSSRRCAR